MVHLYIGTGKGKTSAAIGLCLRAAGHGWKVYVAQFLKSEGAQSGEVLALHRYLGESVFVERFKGQTHPFFLKKRKFDPETFGASLRQAFQQVHAVVKNGAYQVVVLDEVLDVVAQDYMPESALVSIIKAAAPIELILTGRSASARLIRLADYVSRITSLKHPFSKGVKARKGIEY